MEEPQEVEVVAVVDVTAVMVAVVDVHLGLAVVVNVAVTNLDQCKMKFNCIRLANVNLILYF